MELAVDGTSGAAVEVGATVGLLLAPVLGSDVPTRTAGGGSAAGVGVGVGAGVISVRCRDPVAAGGRVGVDLVVVAGGTVGGDGGRTAGGVNAIGPAPSGWMIRAPLVVWDTGLPSVT